MKERERRRKKIALFRALLTLVISATRVLFKQFFTTFNVSCLMLRLVASPPVLRPPLQPTILTRFQLPRHSSNRGSPETQ